MDPQDELLDEPVEILESCQKLKKKTQQEDMSEEDSDDDYEQVMNLKPFTEDREAIKYSCLSLEHC